MNKYELALVVSAKIEDDARTATVEKAKEYITRAGGTVTEVEETGKKKLAYEIQKMSEGYYYFIQFEAAGTVPAAVERDVRIMDNVLRFLVVKKEAQYIVLILFIELSDTCCQIAKEHDSRVAFCFAKQIRMQKATAAENEVTVA